jgi:hypothetical protein
MSLEPSIIVSVVALGGTVVGVLANRSRSAAEARKAHAESEASLAGMAVQLASTMRREIDSLRSQHKSDLSELRERLQGLEERNSLYRRYIGMLITQLTEAQLTPVRPPEPWPGDY